MSQFYSDPERENDTYALPDCQAFFAERGEVTGDYDDEPSEEGWYWWYCFPGSIPQTDAFGPFRTEQEAIDDCRGNAAYQAVVRRG